ncbi:MAG TPA: GTPase-activating protein [Desulfuromonadales bacterium]|nr:GTPase-activating protein [Desulfuromonadales bacterium]
MRFLPKANPLYEKISASNIVVPDVLEKLGKGGFTGYLSHSAGQFEFYCAFAEGKLICTFSSDGQREKSGFEALVQLFDSVLSVGGEVNVYRMTADLAVCVHALLAGTQLFSGEEVRQVDIKGILNRLKVEGIQGAVHFYTPERAALIFYKNGAPIGFYHDQSNAIESSAREAQAVAVIPGARVTVCTTKPIDELMQYDLLQMVNLAKLWEAAQSRNAAFRQKIELKVAHNTSVPDAKLLRELVEDLEEVASAYLSRAGREMVANRISEGGGPALLCEDSSREQFLRLLETDSRGIDDQARIEEMIDLMRSEIVGRLAA